MIKSKQTAKQALLIFFIVLLFLSCLLQVHASEESNITSLTSLPKDLHEDPSIALSGKTVHVVWHTHNINDEGIINYIKSTDNGETWENTTILSTNSTSAFYPVVAVNNDNIYVAWIDYRNNFSEIYYKNSFDNGYTWNEARRLTFESSRKTYIYDVGIVADETNVYLFWKDYRSGSSEIYIKASSDNGLTWAEDQRLTSDYTPSYSPFLIVDGTNCFIIYEDGGTSADLCILTSNNNCESWTEKANIFEEDSSSFSENPCLSISGNAIYLVWQNDMTKVKEIYFAKSQDKGITWDDPQQLTFDANLCINPRVYSYNNTILVLWQDSQNNKFDICYKTSIDDGESWSEKQKLVSGQDCYTVEIAGQLNNIHLAYQNYHEAGWGDICHVVFGEYLPENLTSDQQPDQPVGSTSKGKLNISPSLLAIIVVFIVIIIVILVIKKSKKR